LRVLRLCLDSVTDVATYPSIATPPQGATPPHSATPPHGGAQPFDFGSFGPELDFMLQTGSMAMFPQQCAVSTTPQWNFGGLRSDTFFSGDMTTANTATDFSSLVPPSDYSAMLAHTGLGLPMFSPAVSPSKSSLPLLPPLPSIDYNSSGDNFTWHLQSFTYTRPGSMPNRPQQPIVQYSEVPEGPLLGKRKPVLSLCAQRDNKIGGLVSKENSKPVLVRGKKGKGKCPVPDADESRPRKKAK